MFKNHFWELVFIGSQTLVPPYNISGKPHEHMFMKTPFRNISYTS